jgi:hypothetical protein
LIIGALNKRATADYGQVAFYANLDRLGKALKARMAFIFDHGTRAHRSLMGIAAIWIA